MVQETVFSVPLTANVRTQHIVQVVLETHIEPWLMVVKSALLYAPVHASVCATVCVSVGSCVFVCSCL